MERLGAEIRSEGTNKKSAYTTLIEERVKYVYDTYPYYLLTLIICWCLWEYLKNFEQVNHVFSYLWRSKTVSDTIHHSHKLAQQLYSEAETAKLVACIIEKNNNQETELTDILRRAVEKKRFLKEFNKVLA